MATIVGLFVRWAAIVPVVPPWLAQIAVTAAAAAVGTLFSVLVKKAVSHIWPNRRRRRGDSYDSEG